MIYGQNRVGHVVFLRELIEKICLKLHLSQKEKSLQASL